MKKKYMKLFISISCVIIVLVNSKAHAQVDLQNTGILYISSNTDSLYINGAFINTAAASFTNNGRFYLRQNLTNSQSSMVAGTGTLYLNGSSTQTISGSQPFKTYNLFSANAAGITLNNNLSVSGLHTFTSGLITTSSTPNYLVYEAGSSYTGSSDTRHVNGWVKKIGSTDFTFPVGNASFERPVTLTNLVSASEFNAKHNVAPTPNYMSVYNPLVYVDTSEYWTINRVSGGTARVTMNWDNSKIPFPLLMLSDIRAAYYDGIFWRGIGGAASGNILTTGSVTSNSTNIFTTNFVIGSQSFLLPVKIISFTGARVNEHARISWVIGNELNVDHYQLERSDDGINFYTINTQLALNRNSTELYSYDDQKTAKAITYYRLKITNLNVQVNYSPVITLTTNNSGKDLYVITNPVDAAIDIYAGAAVKGIYNYTISNVSGQLMQSGTLDIRSAGIHSIQLKPVFSAGAYLLVVTDGENILKKTIIKK